MMYYVVILRKWEPDFVYAGAVEFRTAEEARQWVARWYAEFEVQDYELCLVEYPLTPDEALEEFDIVVDADEEEE
jgi:hypothetical protein